MTSMFGKGYIHATPSFSMPNLGLASYTPGYNGRAYKNTNDNYQAPYTTIVYTDPIPIPDSSAEPWLHQPHHKQHNVVPHLRPAES
jgi:hypothetical protein